MTSVYFTLDDFDGDYELFMAYLNASYDDLPTALKNLSLSPKEQVELASYEAQAASGQMRSRAPRKIRRV